MPGHLLELYGVAVSPDLISRVTDAVLEEVGEWQNRPLDPVCPVVFFDALRVRIGDVKGPKGAGAQQSLPRRRPGAFPKQSGRSSRGPPSTRAYPLDRQLAGLCVMERPQTDHAG